MELTTYQLQHELIQNILNISDIDLLTKIQSLIYGESKKHKLTNFEMAFIQESQKQISEGKFYSNDEVFTEMRAWLQNEK